MNYQPDRWVVIRLNPGTQDELYKVLAGWGGSYLYGASWKMNSGITKIGEDESFYYFHGYSGSVYQCHKAAYGFTSLTSEIFSKLKEAEPTIVELLKEEEINVLRQTHG